MKKETKFLVDVLKSASKLITEEFEVNAKDDKGDLVTNFDFEIEKFIISKLKKEYPDFDIISEEFNSDGKLTENCFTIDPIDGTINFANKFAEWVIQVACIKNGETCASVIYVPRLNEMYYADQTGAYLNDKKICVNNLPIKKCLFEIDGKPRIAALERMMPYTRHFRELGSVGIAYSYLAAGRFGGVVFRNETLWDYVPGMYLAKQAGAYIIDEPGAHIAANSKEFAEILKKEAIYKNTDKF